MSTTLLLPVLRCLQINIFKDEMKTRFKMKDLGPIHYCLGMEVRQDLMEGTITLTQSGLLTLDLAFLSQIRLPFQCICH
jgi:hypothetical protein